MVQNNTREAGPVNFTYVPLTPVYQPPVMRGPRVITLEAGRALETLAHAIEYLQDEAALEAACNLQLRNNELEAIDTLKAASRGLWFSLPVREPFWKRWFAQESHTGVLTLPHA